MNLVSLKCLKTVGLMMFILRGAGAAKLFSAANPLTNIEDEGTFVLTLAGQSIGTEKFKIHEGGGRIEAQAEIRLHGVRNGHAFDFKSYPDLVLNAKLQPLAYDWSQKGLRSSRIRIDFSSGLTTVRYDTVAGRQDDREFSLPQDVIILDDNVISQYELVARRYESTPGGEQTFPAFIPQEALPGTLTVKCLGMETVEVAGKKQAWRHLIVSTDLAHIDLWLDQHQLLERMERTDTQFAAVREH